MCALFQSISVAERETRFDRLLRALPPLETSSSFRYFRDLCSTGIHGGVRFVSHAGRLLILLYLCCTANLCAEMIDSNAIITSRSGAVTATDASGERVSVKAHDVVQLGGLQLATEKDSRCFLTLSNGVALALDASTTIGCIEFTQRPFNETEQAQGPEPTVSKIQLQFIEGQIAIATNRLSPLSELRIQMPKGEIRLHKGTCLISYDATGIHITALEGNSTYYYPESEAREFVSAPNSIRISDQSIARQQIAEASTAESLEAKDTQLCLAAQHASKRVTFQPNDLSQKPPVPVLIVSPDYYEQPIMRPYEFKD